MHSIYLKDSFIILSTRALRGALSGKFRSKLVLTVYERFKLVQRGSRLFKPQFFGLLYSSKSFYAGIKQSNSLHLMLFPWVFKHTLIKMLGSLLAVSKMSSLCMSTRVSSRNCHGGGDRALLHHFDAHTVYTVLAQHILRVDVHGFTDACQCY